MNICSMQDCGGTVLARGFCRKHYLRWYKHGDPSKVKKAAVLGEGHGNFVHGMHKHPLYKVWWHMVDRCHNPSNPAHKDYGARGIEVCQEWRDNVARFIADMSPRPIAGLLERRNNDGGYSPENCTWAGRADQNRNRRSNKLTMAKAAEMRERRAAGATRKALAAEFSVSEATVKKVISGAYWSAISAEKIIPTVAQALKK